MNIMLLDPDENPSAGILKAMRRNWLQRCWDFICRRNRKIKLDWIEDEISPAIKIVNGRKCIACYPCCEEEEIIYIDFETLERVLPGTG